VDLRDAHLPRDVRLTEIDEEAQVQDSPLADAERTKALGEKQTIFQLVEGIVLAAHVSEEPTPGHVSRERQGLRPLCVQRCDDVSLGQPALLRKFGCSRGPLQTPDQPRSRLVQFAACHLYPPRQTHDRRSIAKMVPNPAVDGRDGESSEPPAPPRIETVDCLDEADRADLNEILDRLAAAGMAGREHTDEREVELDESRPRSCVAGHAVPAQEDGRIVVMASNEGS
jgi:hypothetical protein